MEPLRVAVAGFGVAGAAVATLLARGGHTVSAYERTPEGRPAGAGVLLQPVGLLALARLGLVESVVAAAEPIHELHAQSAGGRTIMRLRYAEIEPGCHAYGAGRAQLVAPLREAAAAGGVAVRHGLEVRGCRSAPEGAFLQVGEEEEGPFDLVVAADGARSTLREVAGLVRGRHDYAYAALWAVGPCPRVRHKLLQVVRGTRRLVRAPRPRRRPLRPLLGSPPRRAPPRTRAGLRGLAGGGPGSAAAGRGNLRRGERPSRRRPSPRICTRSPPPGPPRGSSCSATPPIP
jgi:2-polyprenyl-6-methoxyphenol hydroxylase-like FAD-dependent oxidoreductase